MTGTIDRRAETRRTINHEFRSVEEFIGEYVVNLSRGGVFIRSDEPLPVGTRVNLRFTVIFEDLEIIEGIGEVVRTVEPGGEATSGMGVVFVELSQIGRDLVERILVRR